jgi:hypothetical protein
MIDVHSRLPTPEEIRERGRRDTRYLLPDAQFRYERALEPPSVQEGFVSVDERAFIRDPDYAANRALILDFDDLREASRVDTLTRYRAAGWLLFAHAWRPRRERGLTTPLPEVLGGGVEIAICPHDAGPPVCWCRKPIPGSVIDFAVRRDVALGRSIVVGTSATDRTIAERIGARYEPSASFFAA